MDIEPDLRELFDAAVDAQRHAYCPYSDYPVGAALRTPSGRIFSGCNVENASFPEGSCSETGAIAAMVAAGERVIVEIVVVTNGDAPGTPCGGCRQRLREFARPDALIHAVAIPSDAMDSDSSADAMDSAAIPSSSLAGAMLTSRMTALLPDSFGPEILGKSFPKT
jgi:cytidine deaminase